MARENAQAKAARLLLAGKVRVLRADRRTAEVLVRGDHDRYRVTVSEGQADCECAAVGKNGCSHRRAALLVCVAGLAMEPSPA